MAIESFGHNLPKKASSQWFRRKRAYDEPEDIIDSLINSTYDVPLYGKSV